MNCRCGGKKVFKFLFTNKHTTQEIALNKPALESGPFVLWLLSALSCTFGLMKTAF